MEEEVFTFPEHYVGNPQEQIISRLAALQEGHKYVILRVNKINGSIKDLYARTESNAADLIRHAGQCVLRGKVEEITNLLATTEEDSRKISNLNDEISSLNEKVASLNTTIAEQNAEKKEALRWKHMLQPIILGFGAAILTTILTLAMLHSSSFVKSDPSPPPIPSTQNGVVK
jgi:vacuolar-type H+-ATPase subunit I/STV1